MARTATASEADPRRSPPAVRPATDRHPSATQRPPPCSSQHASRLLRAGSDPLALVDPRTGRRRRSSRCARIGRARGDVRSVARPTSETDPSIQSSPNIDDVLAADLETSIRLVRRSEDENVALLEHALEADEPWIIDIRIGAEHASSGP